MNVFLSIYHEHMQRTGHDIYAQGKWSTLATTCNVCLYLDAEKRDLEKAEAAYYEQVAAAPIGDPDED